MKSLLVTCSWFLAVVSSYGQCNIAVSSVQVNAGCFGSSTGSIDLTITGGTAPLTFLWNNGAITEDLNNLSAGSYSVVIFDAAACTANAEYIVTQPLQPLTITNQPLPQTDCYGNHVEFSTSVSGAVGTVTYQWQQKPPSGVFSDITGATASLLPVDNIGMNSQNVDGTEYRVLITDACGTLLSASALLRVNSITSITPASVNSTICNGGSKWYEVSASGNIVINGYKWSFNNGSGWTELTDGGSYSGANTSRLTISNATPSQSGSYHVTVTFTTLNQPSGVTTCVETSWSRERNLIVRAPVQPPVITGNQQICYGNLPLTLNASAATGGSGPPWTYQWQTSFDGVTWSDLSGETTLSYSPPALTLTRNYRIKAVDGGTPACGTVYSLPVVIIVNPKPSTSVIYHQ